MDSFNGFILKLEVWAMENQPTAAYIQGIITGILISLLLHMMLYPTFKRLSAIPAKQQSTISLTGKRNEDCKMVFLIRTDLQMTKGKVAAQCGHAALSAYQQALKQSDQTREWLKTWEDRGTTKITLKCPDEPTMYSIH